MSEAKNIKTYSIVIRSSDGYLLRITSTFDKIKRIKTHFNAVLVSNHKDGEWTDIFETSVFNAVQIYSALGRKAQFINEEGKDIPCPFGSQKTLVLGITIPKEQLLELLDSTSEGDTIDITSIAGVKLKIVSRET